MAARPLPITPEEGESEDPQDSAAKEEETGLGSESDPSGNERQSEVLSWGLRSEAPTFTLNENLLGKLTELVRDSLDVADKALADIRVSEQEPVTRFDAGSIPLECSPDSSLATIRRHDMNRSSYLKISPAHKVIYKAFGNASVKGKPLLDMANMSGVDRAALEEWDRDSKELLRVTKLGDTATARKLLQYGADMNEYDPSDDNTSVLMYAAAAGLYTLVCALLSCCCNVDTQNLKGRTALMEAARNGHTRVVRALVKAYANISLRDKSNQSALDLAQSAGHSEVVRFLECEMIKESSIAYNRGRANVVATSQPTRFHRTVAVTPESPAAEAGSLDSLAAEAVSLDSVTAEAVSLDSVTAEAVSLDYVTAEALSVTAEALSLVAEAVSLDSLAAESVSLDSLAAESVSLAAESLSLDSLAMDAAAAVSTEASSSDTGPFDVEIPLPVVEAAVRISRIPVYSPSDISPEVSRSSGGSEQVVTEIPKTDKK